MRSVGRDRVSWLACCIWTVSDCEGFDSVIELARQNPKILFGASVHPFRKDAVAELERF